MTQGATAIAAPAAVAGGTPPPSLGAGVNALTSTVAGIQAQMGSLVAGIAAGGPAALAGGASGALALLQSAESAMSHTRLQSAIAALGPGIGLDSFAGVSGGGPGGKSPDTLDAAELAKFGMGPLIPQGGNLLTDDVLKSFGLDPGRIRAAQQGQPDPNPPAQPAPTGEAAGSGTTGRSSTAGGQTSAQTEEAERKRKESSGTAAGGGQTTAASDD